jgi:hypothetical protein
MPLISQLDNGEKQLEMFRAYAAVFLANVGNYFVSLALQTEHIQYHIEIIKGFGRPEIHAKCHKRDFTDDRPGFGKSDSIAGKMSRRHDISVTRQFRLPN